MRSRSNPWWGQRRVPRTVRKVWCLAELLEEAQNAERRFFMLSFPGALVPSTRYIRNLPDKYLKDLIR